MTFFQKLRKSKKGFTLIELIVVIAILAILAAILIPALISYIQKAKDQSAAADLRSVYSSACAAFTIVQTGNTPITGAGNTSYGGGEGSGLGFETYTLLGNTYVKDAIIVTANKDGVTKVEYNEWVYDAEVEGGQILKPDGTVYK